METWLTAWIAHVLTAAGTIIGVLLVYLQVQKQHQSSLSLQEEHLKNEIRLKVYERIADAVENASNRLGDAISGACGAMMTLRLPDPRFVETSDRPGLAISEAHSAAIGAIAELMTIIERYEIAAPGFVSIRRGLGEGASLLHPISYTFHNEISAFLPMDPRDTAERRTPLPPLRRRTEEGVAELEALFEEYQDGLYTLEAYTADVRIEAQNVLLGQLFGRQVPARQPQDPKYRVLKADPDSAA